MAPRFDRAETLDLLFSNHGGKGRRGCPSPPVSKEKRCRRNLINFLRLSSQFRLICMVAGASNTNILVFPVVHPMVFGDQSCVPPQCRSGFGYSCTLLVPFGSTVVTMAGSGVWSMVSASRHNKQHCLFAPLLNLQGDYPTEHHARPLSWEETQV
jgi:hypothetical protein